MAKTKKKPGAAPTSPYANQIGAESTLRFGPEQSALLSALNDAVDQRDQSIAAAHGAAQGAIRTAQQAAPGVKAITNDVLGQIDQAIATQTPGTVSDLARTRSRLAERMALAVSDLGTRQATAAEGEQYAVKAASDTAAANRSKIFDRLAALGGEAGAYAQGRAAELAGDDAATQTKIDIANAGNATTLAAAGVGPDGTIVAGGPKDPAANGTADKDAAKQADKDAAARAKSLASPDDISAGAAEIRRAMTAASKLKAAGMTRAQAGATLLNGIAGSDSAPVYTPTDRGTEQRVLNSDGTQQVKPGTPAFAPVDKPLWASIALDMVWDGGVSGANVKRLHNPRQRYSVQELNANGINLVTQHQRSQRDREGSQRAAAVHDGASSVAQLVGGLANPG